MASIGAVARLEEYLKAPPANAAAFDKKAAGGMKFLPPALGDNMADATHLSKVDMMIRLNRLKQYRRGRMNLLRMLLY